MDGSLLGVIIGGCIAIVPSLIGSAISLINERHNRQYEERMKRRELECIAKIDALRQYCESLGSCIAVGKDSNLYREYMANFERLSLYVSEETYQAMIALDDPHDILPSDHEYIKLSACLRSEMASALSSSDDPARYHKQERTRNAVQKIHHALSPLRAVFAARPSDPAKPVESCTDQAEHKRNDCKHVSH